MNGMPALQMVAAAAPADEHISWRAKGDIGSGVHRGSELGAAAPYGGVCVLQACWRTCFKLLLQISHLKC